MKDVREFKIGMALIAFVITLSLSLGGFHLYKLYAVDKPLRQELLEIAGVRAVEIDDQKEPVEIQVTLQQVEDLKKTYLAIEQAAQVKMGKKSYVILLKDNPSRDMDEMYDRLELAVYEGIANNSFLWLEDKVDKEVEADGVDYCLQVDEKQMYLSLSKQDKCLYRVIKRNQSPEPVEQGR